MRSNTGLFMTIGNNKFVSYDSKVDVKLQVSLVRSSPIVNWFNRDSYKDVNSDKKYYNQE